MSLKICERREFTGDEGIIRIQLKDALKFILRI